MMKYFRYLILISNLIYALDIYSEIRKDTDNKKLEWETSEKEYKNKQENFINWEIVPKDLKNQENFINWEIFPKDLKNQENFINWEIVPKESNKKEILKGLEKDLKFTSERIYSENLLEINPIFPLNNFTKNNEIQTSIEWKSSFGGGKAGGTGQQNNSFKIDYGLGDFTQLTAIFAEADDDFYNYINGKRAQYSWQNYALSLKKKIWDSPVSNSSISFQPSIEYFRISSGSDETRSIYNEKNDLFYKDNFGEFIYSFAIPYTKKITNKLNYNLVPGFVSLPNRLGTRTTRNNFYGNNFYIGNGFTFDFLENLTLFGSLTSPLGPGNNYFDKNLNFSKKQIYTAGMNWDLNQKIAIETKITNGYGSTPSTGILTLPSDNLTLYTANFKYRPNGKDTYLEPLKERDKLISFGGITVNNALIPKNETGQYSLNIDSKGNYNTSYSYSLSNIFQLELINLGSIYNSNNDKYINKTFTDTYLDKDNFNIRLGGKFLLFSPQKNDALWTSFRTSVGRNESSNQGYIFSELINTYRINSWLAANLSSKYFYSGIEKFGALGASMYLNVTDNLQIIPEINYLLDKDKKSNNTISIRYSFNENKSIDLYLSNALNTQDLGQLLRSKDNKFGVKLNLFY